MKAKRQKKVRKILSFYSTNYGHEAPYKVLLDGTFCKAALQFKLNISEQLGKYLEGEVKLSTTRCVLAECEALGSLLYGPLKILRQYSITECYHKEPKDASECLMVLTFKERKHKRYFIATQDIDLSDQIRSRPGIPLLYISHNAIMLEAPTEKSKQRAERDATDKIQQGHDDLTALKKHVLGEVENVKKKKKKGPKEANPLSCKKAKPKKQSTIDGKVNKRKRKRHKRVHVPDHVKEQLLKNS